MKRFVRDGLLVAIFVVTSLVSFAPSAEAVPSYTRIYGFECSSCHTMWGALNAAGVTFRLSGYRAMFGKTLIPIESGQQIDIPGTNVKIPKNLPFSFITGVGYDYRHENRTAFNGTTTARTGSSLALEDASIFLTGPIGDRFSAFAEFPMYETRAWEFTPTGQSGATSNTSFPGGANDPTTNRTFKFVTEKPIFEVAKFFWNNLLGDSLQRDSFNGLVGITHLPLPYSPGKVRLSVNQYEIYERRALDLISPNHSSLMGPADDLFRLSEPQILAELNGMVVPSGNVTDSAKRETLWFEYHLGVTNANNDQTNNNTSIGGYGRLVGRWYNQSLGVFGLYKPDIYDDNLRTDPAFVIDTNNGTNIVGGIPVLGSPCNAVPPGNTGTQCANTGIFNPGNSHIANAASVFGVDGTLSLAPWSIPLSLDNQIMWRRESSPTGFGVSFSWHGGFEQLNWFIRPDLVTYARYDWIRGSTFNDTNVGGITFSNPNEWDLVAGIQWAPWQNVKLIGEYRYHQFKDNATGTPGTDVCALAGNAVCQPYTNRVTAASITDNGFTVRLMMGL